ncbi:hypothetical protein BDN70DRAFT_979143 [Pholiota conissans]|uniref:F-box domain-containing protein n=1 Tax=Pholiota conissans TaxID=109636 RepID=A0A9P6CLU4_9AGAR|nr:hypothetical protein BDN70DRAFT_979143 [Pholiota conissans]
MFIDSTPCRYCNYLPDGEYICDRTNPNACHPCKKLMEMEDKVKEIRLTLVGLESKRQELKTQANHHHDRLIHRLPPEISGEIFAWCIPEDVYKKRVQYQQNPAKSTLYPSLIISNVCKRWQTIAWSTPRLWKTIALYAPLPSLTAVEGWIQRAGQLSLSIYIHLQWPLSEHNERVAIDLIGLLNRYSTRWLEVTCEGPSTLFSAFQSGEGGLPQLRNIIFDNTDGVTDILIELKPADLNLLSISEIDPAAFQFGWQSLTELEIRNIFDSETETIEALRRAPNLTKCTIEIYGITERLPNGFIHFSCLEDLEIIASDSITFLDDLVAPSLKTLILRPGKDADTENFDYTPLLGFLRNSGCSLDGLSLTFNASISDPRKLASICEKIPTLQHLSLNFCYMMSDGIIISSLLGLLAQSSTVDGKKTPQHLPALRSLHLELETSGLENDILLQSTVAKFDATSLKRILSLEDAGVKWRIEYGRDKFDLIDLALDQNGPLSETASSSVPTSTKIADRWRLAKAQLESFARAGPPTRSLCDRCLNPTTFTIKTIQFAHKSQCMLEKLTFLQDAYLPAEEVTAICDGLLMLQHFSACLCHIDMEVPKLAILAHLAMFSTVDGVGKFPYHLALRGDWSPLSSARARYKDQGRGNEPVHMFSARLVGIETLRGGLFSHHTIYPDTLSMAMRSRFRANELFSSRRDRIMLEPKYLFVDVSYFSAVLNMNESSKTRGKKQSNSTKLT